MNFLKSLFGGTDYTESVRAALAKGATILDVRGPGEFSGGHVPGAINIPHTEVSAQLGKLGPKSRPVVLYCRSGARSSMAAGVLRSAGFAEVIDVGGMGSFPMGALKG